MYFRGFVKWWILYYSQFIYIFSITFTTPIFCFYQDHHLFISSNMCFTRTISSSPPLLDFIIKIIPLSPLIYVSILPLPLCSLYSRSVFASRPSPIAPLYSASGISLICPLYYVCNLVIWPSSRYPQVSVCF